MGCAIGSNMRVNLFRLSCRVIWPLLFGHGRSLAYIFPPLPTLRSDASLPRSIGFRPERGEELGGRQGVNDVFLLQPAAARHDDPVADKREIASVMRVRGDNHLDASLLAHPEIHVFQVQSVGLR